MKDFNLLDEMIDTLSPNDHSYILLPFAVPSFEFSKEKVYELHDNGIPFCISDNTYFHYMKQYNEKLVFASTRNGWGRYECKFSNDLLKHINNIYTFELNDVINCREIVTNKYTNLTIQNFKKINATALDIMELYNNKIPFTLSCSIYQSDIMIDVMNDSVYNFSFNENGECNIELSTTAHPYPQLSEFEKEQIKIYEIFKLI